MLLPCSFILPGTTIPRAGLYGNPRPREYLCEGGKRVDLRMNDREGYTPQPDDEWQTESPIASGPANPFALPV